MGGEEAPRPEFCCLIVQASRRKSVGQNDKTLLLIGRRKARMASGAGGRDFLGSTISKN